MAISDVQISVRGAGALIRGEREKRELPAKELARRAELDASVLSRIEHDTLGMSTDVLARIALALGIKPLKLAQMCLQHIKFGVARSQREKR